MGRKAAEVDRESTVKLFVRAGVPIYPIITHGSYVAWPRWARYPRPARVELEVLEPFRFDRSTPVESALEQLRVCIDIDENVVGERIAPRRAFQPAAGVERLLYRDPVTGESGGIFSKDGVRISNRDRSIKWKMLPDSRILDESTGEILLTGDLYETIRRLPADEGPQRPMLSARTAVSGNIGRLLGIRERSASLRLYRSHLLIEGKDRYHIPIENIRFSSTERN